jgi:hypothetical protein
MTSFQGTFTAPEFTLEDLEEIEGRDGYPDISENESNTATVYVRHLCRVIRSQEVMDRNEWCQLREFARSFPEEAQQVKRDLFRLLKKVDVEAVKD